MVNDEIGIDKLIQNALMEDIGDGDHSSLACIPHDATGKAQLIVKQHGIIAGINIARRVFDTTGPLTTFDQLIVDGDEVSPGDIAFTIEGNIQAILKSERLVLNIMQRMSGIATTTREYVKKLEGLPARVLDTRKTTPGNRVLEKMAVKTGGGENHRVGLYDMIMLKDNHIDYAGGIEAAISKTKKYLKGTGKDLQIEIEARSLDDVETILSIGGVQRIMLDNFDLNSTREAVKMINGRYETESSGGITLDTIRNYAACGVDFVSVGALTHQIRSIDMSLKAM